MNLKALTVTAAMLATAAFAAQSTFAAEGAAEGSEYQWQTPANKWEVQPGILLGSAKKTYKSTYSATLGDSVKVDALALSAKGSYGINEMFAVDGILTYGSAVAKTSPSGTHDAKESGIADIQFDFLGRMPLADGSFRYGTALTISPGNHEVKDNGDSNAFSGGYALTPFVGYEMAMGPGIFGARLSHDLNLGDKTVKTKQADGTELKTKVSGGEETSLAVFYEYSVNPMVAVGGALAFDGWSNTKTKNADGTTDTPTSGMTDLDLKVYVPVKLTDIVLIPQFEYAKAIAMSHYIDSVSAWNLSVDARFTF
jgi:hypothetical protein